MTKTPEELTKEWKAGKLDVGFYYVKGVDGLFGIMSDYALYRVNLNHSDNEMTLLAPVPTYDEYKAMQSAIQNGESAIDTNKRICKTIEELKEQLDDKQKIKAENERLKELLKECVPYVTFKVNIEKNIGCTPPGAYLLTCIKDALGESEER